MDISIIIVNYKTEKLIMEAIKSIIEKTTNISYEIIIVDNNSPNNSIENLVHYYLEYPNIKIISSNENLGFGRACNLGAKNSLGKYLFFLNPDIIFINNALEILYESLRENTTYGVVGGNLYDEEGKPTHSFNLEMPNPKKEISENLEFITSKKDKIVKKLKKDKDIQQKKYQEQDFNFSDENLEVAYICGADMLMSKEIFEKVGGFDPVFFMYYEETELQYRIKKLGYKIMSIPEAQIIHLEGKSFEFKETRFLMFTESKYKFFKKIYGERETKKIYRTSQLKYFYKLITRFFSKKYRRIYQLNKEAYYKV